MTATHCRRQLGQRRERRGSVREREQRAVEREHERGYALRQRSHSFRQVRAMARPACDSTRNRGLIPSHGRENINRCRRPQVADIA